jgi:hypothetical protein
MAECEAARRPAGPDQGCSDCTQEREAKCGLRRYAKQRGYADIHWIDDQRQAKQGRDPEPERQV